MYDVYSVQCSVLCGSLFSYLQKKEEGGDGTKCRRKNCYRELLEREIRTEWCKEEGFASCVCMMRMMNIIGIMIIRRCNGLCHDIF